MSAKANLPEFKGMERFKGDQHHSSRHPGPDAYRGKKAVIIGSNNSAHDICRRALGERCRCHHGAAHNHPYCPLGDADGYRLGGLYSEQAVRSGITTDKADMIFASIPYRILHEFQIPLYQEMARRDAAFYERLSNGRLYAGLGRGWLGAVYEIPAARLRLLHRCGRIAS